MTELQEPAQQTVPTERAGTKPSIVAPARRSDVRRIRLAAAFCAAVLLTVLAIAGSSGWASYRLYRGRALLAIYHGEEARPHLESCLYWRPGDADALILMARGARRADAYADADQYLSECQAKHGMTDALALEQILQAAASGEVDKVAKHCRKLVEENDPATPLILEAMVQGFFRSYRVHEADQLIKIWLERTPDDTQALLFHAGFHALMNRYDDAIVTYHRLLELDPARDVARGRLAGLLIQLMRHAEAATELEQLVRRQPDNAMFATLLADCKYDLDEPAEAEALLDRVLSERPTFGPALSVRGKLALAQRDFTLAERLLRDAVVSKPGDAQLRYQFYLCLLQNGKLAEADAQHRRMKRLEGEVKRLERITTVEMQLNPHDALLQQELGVLLFSQGQFADGVEWLKLAIREVPELAAAHEALAWYYQQVGERGQASQHLRFLPPGTLPRSPIE